MGNCEIDDGKQGIVLYLNMPMKKVHYLLQIALYQLDLQQDASGVIGLVRGRGNDHEASTR